MQQSEGFIDKLHPSYVCKLHKSLYCLKQAPQAWSDSLCRALLFQGFKRLIMNTSLFIYHTREGILWISVYVDDFIVIGSNSSLITSFKQKLHSQFSLKDLGLLSFFLVYTYPSLDTSLICFSLNNSKEPSTPTSTSTQLGLTIGVPFKDKMLYRSTIRALWYLTLARPKLFFIVNKLSQYMHQLSQYLHGTKHLNIHFQPSSFHKLFGYRMLTRPPVQVIVYLRWDIMSISVKT